MIRYSRPVQVPEAGPVAVAGRRPVGTGLAPFPSDAPAIAGVPCAMRWYAHSR